MKKGWISLHRSLQDHWMYKQKREFSKLEAWIDILLTVNHEEKKTLIKNRLFKIKRGQSINSQLTWSKRWNWDRSKVRRFLELLQSEHMIDLKTNNKTTILTVCKYDDYQDKRTSDEHQTNIKRTSNEHQTNTNNNDNNDNNENKYNIPSLEDFLKHAKSRKPNVDIEQVKMKYFSWVDNDWNDGNDKEIKNWKSKLTNTLRFIDNKKTATNNITF